MSLDKVVVILGPTSVGKTSVAIEVAKEFNGEIISADSRQIYKGLDIGTGKVKKEEMDGVPHYLLDVVEPTKKFSVANFKKLAEEKIEEVLSRNKLPILVGGTGFYVQSIVDGIDFPETPLNKKLRKELEEKTVDELVNILKEKAPEKVSEIDQKNKRRLVRAVEIIKVLGEIPRLEKNPKYEVLQIGLDEEDSILKEKIKKRIEQWLEKGLIEEGEKLIEKGLSKERFDELGLEYKLLGQYLRKEISKEEMVERMNTETFQYVKRQRTWFKRDKRIKWFSPKQKREIFEEVKKYIL